MQRLWTLAVIGEAFHVLPSVVARDLDRDTEQLSLKCLPLLRYAEAKGAFDRAKDSKALEPWRGSDLMKQVKENTLALHRERVKAREKS